MADPDTFRDEKFFAPVTNQTMIPRSLAFSLVSIPAVIYLLVYRRYLVHFFTGFPAILSGNFVAFLCPMDVEIVHECKL